MLSRTFFLLACLVTGFLSYCQDLNSFGNASNYELGLKQVPFDPDADAVVLLHEASSTYDDDMRLITNHHVKIKILKEKGLSYADISIPYYLENDFERIEDIQGIIINQLEGGAIEREYIDQKSIFNEKTNKFIGKHKFSFPRVKVGSILDYKFKSVMKHYGGLENWYFQREIPTIKSSYDLMIFPNGEFSYVGYVAPDFRLEVGKNPSTGEVKFVLNNIPGLREEPYMDSRKDYLQRVDFQLAAYGGSNYGKKSYMNSWAEVIKELSIHDGFGGQLNKKLSGIDDFIKLTTPAPAEQKMQLVFELVKAHMTWNGYNSKFSDNIKEAWNKKTGTSADINLALINILKDVGLEVYPLLISERNNGVVNPNLPFLDQFNKVIAAVNINGSYTYLDATSKYASSRLIPVSILNTNALLVRKKVGGIIKIEDDASTYRKSVVTTIEISDTVAKGNSNVTFSEYSRNDNLEEYRSDNAGYIEKAYKNFLTNGQIKDFESINEAIDSLPYRQTFNFNYPVVNNSGYYFINANMFTGLDKNPFVDKRRFSNINFGSKQQLASTVRVIIPAGFKIDALPKSLQITNADRSMIFSREIIKSETSNDLQCRIKFETKKSLFGAENYPDVHAFYKKMFELLNEQIVLKK